MGNIVSASPGPKLAAYGKRIAAEATYAKGKAFVEAAILLRRRRGYDDVVLHLLCQGIEVVLKGLLLAMNYDQFKPRLEDLGRDLVHLAEETAAAAGLKSPSPALQAELERLSNLYSVHAPRYGTSYDIVINPTTIRSARILRRTAALVRLVGRKMACAASPARLS